MNTLLTLPSFSAKKRKLLDARVVNPESEAKYRQEDPPKNGNGNDNDLCELHLDKRCMN